MRDTPNALRLILGVDALTCALAAAIMLLGAEMLSPVLSLPRGLLSGAGAALVPIAALFGWMSLQSVPPRPLIFLAVLGNALWVAASLAIFVLFRPSLAGIAFVAAQATAVTILAGLEFRHGLARAAGLTAVER